MRAALQPPRRRPQPQQQIEARRRIPEAAGGERLAARGLTASGSGARLSVPDGFGNVRAAKYRVGGSAAEHLAAKAINALISTAPDTTTTEQQVEDSTKPEQPGDPSQEQTSGEGSAGRGSKKGRS